MTRRIITLLACVFSAQLFAFEPTSAISVPKLSRDDTLSQSSFAIDSKVHPTWMHQIVSINTKKSTITLEDGSEWKAGYWYSGILKSWAVGDQVTVSWYSDTYFLDTQIKNHTKESYTWCQIKEAPQPNASGFLFIQSVPNRMTLVLSDGTRITSTKSYMFYDFSEGDVVHTLYGKGTGTKTPYSLWDVSSGYIAYDLNVELK